MYSTEGKVKEPNLAADIGQGLMGIASSYAKKDMGGLLKGGLGVLRAASGGAQKAGDHAKRTRSSPADVVSTRFSGKIRSLEFNLCCRSLGVAARILKPARIRWRRDVQRAL
jgi:hypothetical protein